MNFIYGKTVPVFQCDKQKKLVAILCKAILKYPQDHIAAIDAITKETITMHHILEDAVTIAKHFRSIGVVKGDVVAIMVENSIHFASYLIATLFSGAIFAPLNPTFTCYELEQICLWMQPKIMVCNPTSLANAQKVQEKYNYHIIDFNLAPSSERQCHIENSLGMIDLEEFLSLESSPKDPVMIICSSGTTGLPKGVVHSNFSILSALDYLTDTQLGFNNTDIVLAYLPFYHVMGLISVLANLYCGQKLIILQKFKPQVFLNAVQEFSVNKMFIVPTVGLFLSQYEDIVNYDLSPLKELVCAGSMLSVATYNEIKQKLPHCDIRLAYGMSEINYTTITTPFSEYHGSVGQLVAGCVGKVIDPDTFEALPAYKTGELLILSKSNFSGYYRNEKDTLCTIDVDGFVHTGDIVYYNENGDIFIVDRIKELIKHKSFQVSPVELEAILLKHDYVADVGVIGVPDEKCGELPRAFIVLRSNITFNNNNNEATLRKELQDFVSAHVSPYKQLSGGVRFVPEIPKNASGKILRRQLKAKYLVEE